MGKKIFYFVIISLSLFSCVKTETTKITSNVKIVKYLSENSEKSIVKKYNKVYNQWFEVFCSLPGLKADTENSITKCVNNLEYTKLSMSKMNIIDQNKGRNKNIENIKNIINEQDQNEQDQNEQDQNDPFDIPGECEGFSEC